MKSKQHGLTMGYRFLNTFQHLQLNTILHTCRNDRLVTMMPISRKPMQQQGIHNHNHAP